MVAYSSECRDFDKAGAVPGSQAPTARSEAAECVDQPGKPTFQRTGAAFDVAGAGGTVTAAFSQAGNLTSVDHDWASGGGVTVTYAYDLGHRLRKETFSDADYRWVLGAANTETYDPDRLNRYVRADGDQNVDMTYDGNHNLATWGAWAYTHDPENRLTRAQRPGMAANFVYDPLGRRVRKTASGGISEAYLLAAQVDPVAFG